MYITISYRQYRHVPPPRNDDRESIAAASGAGGGVGDGGGGGPSTEDAAKPNIGVAKFGLAVVAGERKVVFKSMTSSLYSAVQENVEARKSEQRIEQRKFLKLRDVRQRYKNITQSNSSKI